MRVYPKSHFAAGKRRKRQRRFRSQRQKSGPATLLIAAAIAGTSFGVGTVALTPEGMASIQATLRPVLVSLGIVRARLPQPGDYWRGCDEARAAGTAPIYEGEPGYREGMDGDGDGEACEPYRRY